MADSRILLQICSVDLCWLLSKILIQPAIVTVGITVFAGDLRLTLEGNKLKLTGLRKATVAVVDVRIALDPRQAEQPITGLQLPSFLVDCSHKMSRSRLATGL